MTGTSGDALSVDSLTVGYGGGARFVPVVEEVSFCLPRGTTLGLVGESGSGKSTIAKAIVGLLRPRCGRVSIGGRDITADRGRAARGLRRRVQLVPQDPYGSLNPRMTVGRAIGEAIGDGSARTERDEEVDRLLRMVALDPMDASKYPHQFSGGQRQRIAIARALAVRPDVVIADEVTSSLDCSVQAEVLNLLKDIQERLSLSVLFISHDLAVVSYVSEHVAVLHRGRVVELGELPGVFDRPEHPYTTLLVESVPDVASPSGCAGAQP